MYSKFIKFQKKSPFSLFDQSDAFVLQKKQSNRLLFIVQKGINSQQNDNNEIQVEQKRTILNPCYMREH